MIVVGGTPAGIGVTTFETKAPCPMCMCDIWNVILKGWRTLGYSCAQCGFHLLPEVALRNRDFMLMNMPRTWQVTTCDGHPVH